MKTKISAIVTDIEGTTTSLSFVKDILFPYAEINLPDYVKKHALNPQVLSVCNAVRAEMGEPQASQNRIIETLLEWARADQKIGPLKELQGLIWEDGYRSGDYFGHIYPDAVDHLRNWHASGIPLYVYSSGSVHAQKLLFAHTNEGDLTYLFSGYFDTQIGGKKEVQSYRRITDSIAVPASETLFLSDIAEELDAATQAGMQTYLLARASTKTQSPYLIAHDFSEIQIETS
jgi:enolase-phosphatase E1